MIGVSYNEFWDLNPSSLQPFIKAFSLKNEQIDTTMWSLGQYIRCAIASSLSKDNKYPNEPFSKRPNPSDVNVIKQRFLTRMINVNSIINKDGDENAESTS